jgi:hypothetical protein
LDKSLGFDLPIMACLLFTYGVTNKEKNPRTNIGILCYLNNFAIFFLPKLEYTQFKF